MRIMLFAAGGDIGGGKTHILSLAKELAAENELRLLSFRRGALSSEAVALGIDTVDVDGNAGTIGAFRLALAQVEDFKPDIIHCHGAKANMLGTLVKRIKHVPVMTTVHSDPRLDYLGMPIKQYTYGLVNAYALRRMDYYVAVADRMQEVLIERGFDPENIFTVYNGLDFSGARQESRQEKVPGEVIRIGIAARLTPIKDIATVIRAFAKAYKQEPALRLSIAGTGEDAKPLQELAGQLGVSHATVFEGWVEDIKAYFSGIDINVLASLSETFPYSLLEGAYQHCPAIATNVGGISKLIDHGYSGYLFNPGDVDTFSQYILELARDAKLRTTLADNLFDKASKEFSLEKMKEDQQHIYETVLRRSTKVNRPSAVLCGAYGRGNAGDEAILRAILQQLRRIDEDMSFQVMSRNPVQTKKKEKVGSYYIFDVPSFLLSLREAGLFVNGGGSLMQDATSSRSLYFYLFTLWAARRFGCRVVMYGCGIGPISKARNRRIAGKILNETADIITLRDSVSFELLRDMGVTKPEIVQAADPAINLAYADEQGVKRAFASEGIPADVPMIGFCLRAWETFTKPEEVAKAAEYAWHAYGLTPVFLPIEMPKDVAVGERVASMLSVPHYVCRNVHPVEDIIGMLGSMELVLGMRLHSLIFATAGGAPVVGISYDVKVDSFIKDIGSDACVSLAGLNAAALCRFIDDIATGRVGKTGAHVRKRLQEQERVNGQAAARLLAMGRRNA